MIKNILNLGDAAIYYDFGNQINKETNKQVIDYFNSIKKSSIDGIKNLIPSYNKLVVSFDLEITNFSELKKKLTILKFLNLVKKKTRQSKYLSVVMTNSF